jgi:beta-glucosidase
MISKIILCSALLLLTAGSKAQNNNDLYNSEISFEKRVESLISKMTLEEKISQMQYLSPAIPRLNVPAYNWWNPGGRFIRRYQDEK